MVNSRFTLAQVTRLHRRQFFRPIMAEEIGLAHHRPQSAHLQHQPLQSFRTALAVAGQQLPGFFRQPEQNGARFHHGKVIVDQARHLAVGVQFQELRPLLLALGQIERLHGIAQAHLLQRDGNLVAIGRGRGEEDQAHGRSLRR
jgi:hypothetical protein